MALTPEQIEHLATVLVHGREQELIRRIREQLVGSVAKDGVLTATELHQAEVLYELNRDALTQILLEHKGPIADETKRAVWDILAQSHHGDIARLAPAYGMALDAVATANITAIGKQAAIGIARAIERANLDLAHGALESYRSVVEKATVDYIHSAKPTDKIITEAVAELSDQVEMVNYVSGARARIDTAIRRILYTEVAQANSRMARARLDYYGHDLVITSSHAASRPDHFHWQGHVFSLTGRTPGYPTLEQGTDYGSVTGLAGANCRHTFGPWFEGDPVPGPGMSEEDNLKAYESSQKQRAIERDIRATKREIYDLEGRGGDVTGLRLKLGQQQKRMREFLAETGLPRQPLREKAYGISKQPRALTVDPRKNQGTPTWRISPNPAAAKVTPYSMGTIPPIDAIAKIEPWTAPESREIARLLARKLTAEQRFWLTKYTDAEWHRGFAAAMRGLAPMTPDYLEASKVITDALHQFALPRATRVFRNMTTLPPGLRITDTRILDQFPSINSGIVEAGGKREAIAVDSIWRSLIGAEFTDSAPLSTSYLEDFTGRYGSVKFEVSAAAGAPGVDISSLSLDELDKEILFAPGQRLRVVDVDTTIDQGVISAIFRLVMLP